MSQSDTASTSVERAQAEQDAGFVIPDSVSAPTSDSETQQQQVQPAPVGVDAPNLFRQVIAEEFSKETGNSKQKVGEDFGHADFIKQLLVHTSNHLEGLRRVASEAMFLGTSFFPADPTPELRKAIEEETKNNMLKGQQGILSDALAAELRKYNAEYRAAKQPELIKKASKVLGFDLDPTSFKELLHHLASVLGALTLMMASVRRLEGGKGSPSEVSRTFHNVFKPAMVKFTQKYTNITADEDLRVVALSVDEACPSISNSLAFELPLATLENLYPKE